MKTTNKKITSFCLAILLAASNSCDKALKDNLPADYASIVHFDIQQGENEKDLVLLNVGEPTLYNLNVRKSGNQPSAPAKVNVRLYSQEEVDEHNNNFSTNYVILPNKYYEIANSTLAFDDINNNADLEIKFYTAPIATELDKELTYILPLKLEAIQGSVNPDLGFLILKPSISTPTITLDLPEIQTVEMDLNDETKTVETPLTLYIDLNENKWNFQVELETDKEVLENEVEKYKISSSNSSYQLLPQENYTLPNVIDFSSGEVLVVNNDLVIDRGSLTEGDYLLPILTKSIIGQPFAISQKASFIHVRITDQLPAIHLNSNMLTTTRTEMGPTWGEIPRLKEYLLDGDPSTYWQSEWTVFTTPGDERKPHDAKYGLYVDVKLDEPIKTFSFDYQTTSKNSISAFPAHIQVYVGNDENSLTPLPVMDLDQGLPTDLGKWYKSKKYNHNNFFKYIRFAVIKNVEGANLKTKGNSSIIIAELRVFGK